ncbi:unnamed protein product, partial [Timema podura]|nr:unnamed protein product [Timema podura]
MMGNYNFDKICRLCMAQKEAMLQIFEAEVTDEPVLIPDRIMMCATVKISLGDGLPSQICKTCAQELDVSFHFRRKCENSDVSLRRLLGKCEIDSEEV